VRISSARRPAADSRAIVSAIAAAHGAELRAVTRAAGGLAVEVVFPPVPGGAGRREQKDERAAALA
jgi:hypothetical protein